MTRALIVIRTDADRSRAAQWCHKAPEGYRIEFKATKRTLDQNSLFWSLLTSVAAQKEHYGKKYPPETWKMLFMQAWGREIQFVPSLNEDFGFVPVGFSSSDLSKGEMSELIEFIYAWGAENGIRFHEGEAV